MVFFKGGFFVEARAVAMVPAGFFVDAFAKNLLAAVGVFYWAAREGRLHAFGILVWALWLRHLSGCCSLVAVPTICGEATANPLIVP